MVKKKIKRYVDNGGPAHEDSERDRLYRELYRTDSEVSGNEFTCSFPRTQVSLNFIVLN